MISVQHIAMNCRDLRNQEEFYKKHFGFNRVRTFSRGKTNEFVMLRLRDLCMELFQANSGTSKQGGEQLVGFKHLAFGVSKISEVLKSLHGDGICTEDVVDCSSILKGMSVCFFNDPEGNRIELIQGYQDE
jgi:catechol 2,3-dioxygenase-like lactoylglutathione lyase family enzyme